MKLKEGGYYLDRRGDVHGPMSFDPHGVVYKFKAPNGDCYSASGMWDVFSEDLSDDPRDLIEEVSAPESVTDSQNILQRLSTLEGRVQKLLAKSESDDDLRISLAEDYFREEIEKLNGNKSATIIPIDLKEERRRAAARAFDIADAFLTELEDRRKRGRNVD